MKKIIILGCGGHAKTILDILKTSGEYQIVGFVDREIDKNFSYRGYRIVGDDTNLEQLYSQGIHYACIGIGYLGNGTIREELTGELKKYGFILPPIIDRTAIIAGDVILGEGCYIGKKVVVNANVNIGKMAIVNTGAIIEHDCTIGDFTHISVAAVICGGTKIGRRCLVGANATVIQGIVVGNESVVGAGAVVNTDIRSKMVAVGVPAIEIAEN